MRLLLALLVVAFAGSALAQTQARPRPPGTAPLEEPPPPPRIEFDPALEPQVTLRTEGEQTIQEFRVNGKLFMVRVTPKHGRPYIMIDHKGDGHFARQDGLDSGVRVPQWVLVEF